MVSLRVLDEDDALDLVFLANNINIWNNVRDYFPHPYSQEDADFFIDLCKKEKPKVTFAIEDNNKLCGVIGLVLQKDVYKHSAEIGYWIGEPFWRKGIATNAVKQMVEYAFQELKLERIFAGIFEYNKASMRVLDKCGFQLEGISKKALIKNGRFWDEYRYAIVN